jgi:putative transposase
MQVYYTGCMNCTITAKLKLYPTPAQFGALRQTQLAYRDALNYVSRYAFEHGKMSNTVGLQAGTYLDMRAKFGLPAQMACSVPRQVSATYKTLWTRVKTNATARAAGHTKKRYRGLDRAPKYIAPTLTYQLGHDYGFKTGQQVSLLTLEGRLILSYTGFARHVALLQQGARIGAGKLWYDKPHKQFFLLVSLQIEVVDPVPEQHQRIVGVDVDVGQRYLAVATDTQDHARFFPGKAVRAIADHYARLRKRLQHKGTRSATRRLIVIAGRERRLKHERNHSISRQIVDAYPHSLIGLEDLTHIRERTHHHHRKRATAKQRRANRHASQWAFSELQGFVAYKALLSGSMAVRVDAYKTSQACPRCGYTAADNRPDKGLLFVCQACHLVLHADLVGARNVALRTLLARHDWVRTGVLSERPEVSDGEAKAVRPRRYTELRWSPDTSPRAFAGGI